MRRGFLELFVFDQLADQVPARIIFLGIFFRRLLIDRQQAAAFQIDQVRRHDDELARDVDVQFLERLEIFEVLARDPLERDIVDIELVALDQIKQEIERPFEDLELNLVIRLHAGGNFTGRRRESKPRAAELYRSTISLRWIQTLFTMPRPNMIMSTNEPL